MCIPFVSVYVGPLCLVSSCLTVSCVLYFWAAQPWGRRQTIPVPVQKNVVFRCSPGGNRSDGVSVTESCVRSWFWVTSGGWTGCSERAGRWWFLVHYFVFDGFHHWGRMFFDESAAALFCFTGPWMALLLLLVPTLCFLLPLGESFILCY